MSQNRNAWLAIAGVIGAGVVWRFACHRSSDPAHEGKIRQTAHLRASDLRRGAVGMVNVSATAAFTSHETDQVLTDQVRDLSDPTLWLTDAAQKRVDLAPEAWSAMPLGKSAKLKLPDTLPDGDYQLHAAFSTHIGKLEVAAPLALYTPARIHVITDRPLYEPGNTVKFRAVVLRARDLAPLDGRPGRWIVKDASGETLLEEKAPAGDWGVVAGSFPIDKQAQTGQWHVAWVSADAREEVPFTVQPFVLPRFHVDAAADKAFYQAGDKPVVRGSVVYASGAPVAKARLEIQWGVSGDWPPPTDWLEKTLPQKAETEANGSFVLDLPAVPQDLQGKATIVARIAAIDPAGDRVESSTAVLLSADAIAASTVTELSNGLIQSQNNRVYLRVTSADGRTLAGQKVTVKRAWEATDKGLEATLDEDGVASFNLDPGAPVNIVIPPAPYRPSPRPKAVTHGGLEDLIGGEGGSLADQVAVDKWLAPLASCALFVDGESENVKLGVRVEPGGGLSQVTGGATILDQCAARVVRGQRMAPGGDRLYAIDFSFTDQATATVSASIVSAIEPSSAFEAALHQRAIAARTCLRPEDGVAAQAVSWHGRAGDKFVELTGWFKDPQGEAGASGACLQQSFSGRVELPEPLTQDGLGYLRFTLESTGGSGAEARPQATTLLGYELAIETNLDGKPATTKLRFEPGALPALRMRATPVLPKPGETVVVDVLRSPEYTGELPKELALSCLKHTATGKLDDQHKASFVIPAVVEGWCEITGGGARALVYIRPQAELTVAVKPERERYAPGEIAKLVIQTSVKAAVGLFGVDQSLGQLVPLPGADALAKLRPQVTDQGPIFGGALDGQALVLGRIRGANAAAATVMRVATIPPPPALDAVVSANGDTQFDAIGELTDHFYIVLAELHAQVRAWEEKAPATEKMVPATLARLWNASLDAVAAKGQPNDDAYGRRLRLSLLPRDLLELTDPRNVIVVGTRLPEDVENWAAWVAKEKP